MMMKTRFSILLAALPITLLAPAAHADDSTQALMFEGQLLEVESGAYSSFFEDDAQPAEQPVLVLNIRDGATTTTELVPTTQDGADERSPLLLHDPATDRATIVWESHADESMAIRFAERAPDGTWTEGIPLVEIASAAGNFFRSITREVLKLTLPDGRPAEAHREMVHFVWWQDDQLAYASLLAVGGSVVASLMQPDLLALFEGNDEVSPTVPSHRLRETISVSSLNLGSLSATLVDPRNDRIVAIELSAAHVEVQSFVTQIRDEILATLNPDSPISAEIRTEIIASGIRTEIIASGLDTGMDDALIDFISTTGENFTAGYFDLNPQATAADWVEALTDLLLQLLASIYATADGADGPIQIGLGEQSIVQVKHVFDQPAPVTGDGATRVYVAPGGRLAVIGWHDPDSETVFWIESTADPEAPWTEPRSLLLDEGLDLDQADALLRQRVQ